MNNNIDNLIKIGCELYDKGYYLKTKEELQAIVDCLKTFVEANKLSNENIYLKPKILNFIASCNYKIGNIDTAYKVALKGKLIIPKIISCSPFIGITGVMLGEDRLDELLAVIDQKYYNQIDKHTSFEDIDENIINIEKISTFLV